MVVRNGAMDPNTVIDKIGDGNLRETARRLSVPVTTLSSWRRAGYIPHWRADRVRSVARELGVELEGAVER